MAGCQTCLSGRGKSPKQLFHGDGKSRRHVGDLRGLVSGYRTRRSSIWRGGGGDGSITPAGNALHLADRNRNNAQEHAAVYTLYSGIYIHLYIYIYVYSTACIDPNLDKHHALRAGTHLALLEMRKRRKLISEKECNDRCISV